MKKILFIVLLSLLLVACKKQIKIGSPLLYPNLINYRAIPTSSTDLSKNAFMDKGSWLGLSFFPDQRIGIAGLFGTNIGQWISPQLCQISIEGQSFLPIEQRFYPGFFVQRLANDSLLVLSKIYFYTANMAVIDISLTNKLSCAQNIKLFFSGKLFPGFHWDFKDSILTVHFTRLKHNFTIALSPGINIAHAKCSAQEYEIMSKKYELGPHHTNSFRVLVYFGQKNINLRQLRQFAATDKNLFASTLAQWNYFLRSKAVDVRTEYRSVAVKSILTLVNNWKKAYGPFAFNIIIPSYSAGYFTGIWAWDSWKHAAATALFDPALAEQQILSMLRFQDTAGMIYDCVCLDETHKYDSITINQLDTKPPLAAWAAWHVFLQNHDTAFLRRIYPAVKKFHYWWYRYRDYNHNGLCEYGSEQNKVYAARWESGMDDAVRFDSATLVQGDAGWYSLSQESPDLNAFLYADKLYLARIANVLGYSQDAKRFLLQAHTLARLINKRLWCKKDQWYYDRNTVTGKFVRVLESSGWIPLWAGVPDSNQAAAIARRMADTREFNTHVPLPTISAADKHFMTGYWRGPVWLDQVYFGLSGLRRYGYDSLANALLNKLIHNAKGILGQGELYENYNPTNGEPLNARNFSWTAASLLLMLNKTQ